VWRVAEQAERQVIAVMQSSPRRPITALEEVSGAALAVEDLKELSNDLFRQLLFENPLGACNSHPPCNVPSISNCFFMQHS